MPFIQPDTDTSMVHSGRTGFYGTFVTKKSCRDFINIPFCWKFYSVLEKN